MDISPQDSTVKQSTNDDQELAKALAGISGDESAAPATPSMDPATDAPAPAPQAPTAPEPAVAPAPEAPVAPATSPTPSGDLDGIKKDALTELRPLIDKVDLPAEEKFDTYLMLIRSTDDSALIAPAHAAAQAISDEKRRAEALLDIIKEIDYLTRDKQASA